MEELNGKQKKAVELLAEGKYSLREVAGKVGIHRTTLTRWLKQAEFLSAFKQELTLSQCQDLQKIYQIVQKTYEEFLRRMSGEQLGKMSTLHLVKLMDRLYRQLNDVESKLEKLQSMKTKSAPDESQPALLSEEGYRDLAREVLKKMADSSQGSPAVGAE
mgnify:CR=1 FL=1